MNKLWTMTGLGLLVIAGALMVQYRYVAKAGSCPSADAELWAHRGLHQKWQENSPDAVAAAVAQGFTGVEVDVFIDKAHGLVVSHDQPYHRYHGQLVSLGDIFAAGGPGTKYWIDLKNLSRANRRILVESMDQLVESGVIDRNRCFFESSKAFSLRYVGRYYPTIYWVQLAPKGWKRFPKLAYHKTVIAFSAFAGITTHYRYINDAFRRDFSGKCWYVFTSNDIHQIRTLRNIPEVSVILTDMEIHSIAEPIQ